MTQAHAQEQAGNGQARGPGRVVWVVALLAVITALSASCTRIDNTLAKVPFFAFMHESPAFDPYEAPRPPPPGAVPFESPAGWTPPPIEPSIAGLVAFGEGPFGVNPLDDSDPAVIQLGQTMYERHCFPCHGRTGAGDGPVVGPDKLPAIVRGLTTPTAIELSDGYIYAIIDVGRGLMPPYGPRTTHEERWAIVTYVRQLQAAVAPAGGAAPGAAPGGGGS